MAFFSKMRFKWYICLRLHQKFNVWFFSETSMGFFAKSLSNISKSLNLAKFFWNASQRVLLLQSSQKIQKFRFFRKMEDEFSQIVQKSFFWENKSVFPKKNFNFFVGGKLGAFYLECFANGIFPHIFSKYTIFGVLCRKLNVSCLPKHL